MTRLSKFLPVLASVQDQGVGRLDADARYSDDPIMGKLSNAQIEAGIKRGLEQLALIDALDAQDNALFTDHGAHDRPSKAYESYFNAESEARRRHLNYAIREARAELLNRACVVSA